MRKIICWIVGHRSIQIFSHNYKWEHQSWAQTITVHKCERCEHETQNTWQQGI